jgi:VIT1/CCC1 family predicted Fe2+/Mn2+ transporter
VSQLAGDLSNLVRKESELVRTELTEKLNAAGRAAAEVAAGGVFLIAALLVLLQALVLALSHVMPAVWASLLVGVVVAVLGWVLVRAGMKAMNPKSLTPDRTARQLSKDADLLKGH